MDIYRFSFPLDNIIVTIFDNINIDPKSLSDISKNNQPSSIIFSIPEKINPCSLALIYSYVMEDYDIGENRISNIALRALLYLTRSNQLSSAIEKSKSYKNIAIVTNSINSLIKALSSLNIKYEKIKETKIGCNLNELNDITSFRLLKLLL
ncbi:MAG: hypothetical protein ACP5I6_00070 [Caldisphaera sp.]